MERRDGLEPHRLVARRVERREPGGLFRRLDPGGRRDRFVGLAPASFQPCRVAGTEAMGLPGICAAVQIARASCASFSLPDTKGRTALAGNSQGSWPNS